MSNCVTDTNSIDLTASGGALSADLIVAPAAGIVPNLLSVGAGGVTVAGGDGWVALPSTLTPTGGPLGKISYYLTSINLLSLVAVGSRVKFTQNGSVHYFVVIAVSSTQLSLFSVDGSTVDASAVTLPSFSVGVAPAGTIGGSLAVSDGNAVPDVVALAYEPVYGRWVSPERIAYQLEGTVSRTAGTYQDFNSSGSSGIKPFLPFKAFANLGVTWQFRWTATVSWAASQSSSGVRLSVLTGDYNTAGPTQDAANTFGEVTSFVANASRLLDSGWVDINPSIALKDVLNLEPQLKSDGTRSMSITAYTGMSVRARLVL